jgi:hypothetical protein
MNQTLSQQAFACNLLPVTLLFGLSFEPEVGDNMYLRNVG